MTWLTWRQLRTSAAATYAVLLLLAVLPAMTRPPLAHLAATAGNGFLSRAQGTPPITRCTTSAGSPFSPHRR